MQSLPRLNLLLVLLVVVANGLAFLVYPQISQSQTAGANAPPPSSAIGASANAPDAYKALVAPLSIAFERELTHPELPVVRGEHWQAARVHGGDNLASIFQRMDIPPDDLAKISGLKPYGSLLAHIRPGATLEYRLNDQHQLALLRYPQSRLQTLLFQRTDNNFVVNAEMRTPETRLVTTRATVDRTLFTAAKKAGVSTQMVMSLAQIFQWDIDFALGVHPGDSFSMVYESQFVDGEHIADGAIVAAEFINRGRRYQAIRFTGSDGRSGYFTPDGRNLRKAFLRAPLEFARVSSTFSMRRMHPIMGKIMPHLGIDYAAPVGTPIWAAGDGRIAAVASDLSSGRNVVIAHGTRYETRYKHMSAFARGLHVGEHVTQGQVIGYVGQTGWATGPHLHFEFLAGGAHMNPADVTMIEDPIAPRDRSRFANLSSTMLASLDAQTAYRVALNTPVHK